MENPDQPPKEEIPDSVTLAENKRRQVDAHGTATWAGAAETPTSGDKECAAFEAFLELWKQIQEKKNGDEPTEDKCQEGGQADQPNIAGDTAAPSVTLGPDDIDAMLENVTGEQLKK